MAEPIDMKAGEPAAHCGVVAVVGRTNAGKSTLVNRLVGEKVSIESPVSQTTRTTVRGVLTEERGQLVLLDTPGLHRSRNLLGRTMNKAARGGADGADAVLLVCDASRDPREEDEGWMSRLARRGNGAPVVVFLNKSDRSCHEKAFRQAWSAASAAAAAPRFLRGSARTGEGVDALLSALFSALPPGPLLFDGDTLSDHPRRLAVADLIREQFFRQFDDELPHAIGVGTDEIDESSRPVRVKATAYVRRGNQKGIVLGEKGRSLRAVKRRAEAELSKFFDAPCVLDIWIRVEPDWDENFFLLRQLGYR